MIIRTLTLNLTDVLELFESTKWKFFTADEDIITVEIPKKEESWRITLDGAKETAVELIRAGFIEQVKTREY